MITALALVLFLAVALPWAYRRGYAAGRDKGHTEAFRLYQARKSPPSGA